MLVDTKNLFKLGIFMKIREFRSKAVADENFLEILVFDFFYAEMLRSGNKVR